MIFEKWGGYGNSERRTQLWRQQVPPPGEARSDVWQMMEFSKRFTLAEVWGEQPVPGLKAEGFEDGALPDVLAEAERAGLHGATRRSTTSSSPRRRTASSRWPDPVAQGHDNHTVVHAGRSTGSRRRRSSRSTPRFGRGHGHDLAPFDVYFRDDVRGLRWPVVERQGDALALQRGSTTPTSRKGSGFDFYGDAMKSLPYGRPRQGHRSREPISLAGKAKIFFRPYAAPAGEPRRRSTISGSAPAGCSSTGTRAR